jgi:hypothetical protein
MADIEDDPEIVHSPLCQHIARNGITVEVAIYSDSDGKWILEMIDAANTSHVWDDHFDTDEEALAEAVRALEEEPMEFMPDDPGSASIQ